MTDRFTYVSAFLSIVVALALAQLLGGVANILRAKVVRWSATYLAWLAIMLFGCVDYWFSLWGLRAEEHWSLAYVGFLLVLATLLYLNALLFVPEVRDGEPLDLVEFADRNRRRYLAAFFAYIVLGTITNLTISGLAGAVWINFATLALVAIAWLFADRRVQAAVAAALVALFAYYAATFIPAL
jgi:hypothetical protein